MSLFSAKPICVEFCRRTSPITIVGDRTARYAKQHHAVRRCLFLSKHAKRSPRSLCSAGYTTFIARLHDKFLRPTGRRPASWGFKTDPNDPEMLIRTGDGLAKAWKGRIISEIKRADVVELINQIVDRGSPKMANRTLAWIRKMFSWAASQDIVTLSPCVGVKSPAPETERDRVLCDAELKMIWEATHKIGQPFGPLIKLLILTAQRREEVAAVRWAGLDLKRRKWTIRRERVYSQI